MPSAFIVNAVKGDKMWNKQWSDRVDKASPHKHALYIANVL